MTKHVKIAEPILNGSRDELRDAIAEVIAAESAAAKADEAAELAHDRLREKERTRAVAALSLEEARAPRLSLADRLADCRGEEEKWWAVEQHRAAQDRPAVTLDDLNRLQSATEAADDDVVVARSAAEAAEAAARPTVSALARAKDRRTRAVHALVGPHVDRLIADVDLRTQELVAARAALAFVSSRLIDGLSEERRRASFALSDGLSFPEEAGLKVDRDTSKRRAAIEAWMQFAERIAMDASEPFPS
jgi:hypothetical protein